MAGLLFETGFQRPTSSLTLRDKDDLVNTISSYHTVIKVKAEIDMFVVGLESLRIHEFIKLYPTLMKSLFVNEKPKQISAGRTSIPI